MRSKSERRGLSLPVVRDDRAATPPTAGASRAPILGGGVTRRQVLKATATAAAATSYLAGCDAASREAFFQRHFKELSKSERDAVIARLEKLCRARYGKDVKVGVEPPLPKTLFGYALDIGRCVGCRRCVYACVDENNQSRDPQVHWITVLEMEKSKGVDFHSADPYYSAKKVPRDGHFYLPVQCQQCENPPCVKVCPAQATWTEKDGIVVVDYDWCIGCRCCVSACPYGARRFNWAEPEVSAEEPNVNTHYLGNRPRPKGVVEKCTLCIQRTRKGRYPACVEICPVGARKFGNLLDPKSEIRELIATQRVFVLKEELNTQPKFFYYHGA